MSNIVIYYTKNDHTFLDLASYTGSVRQHRKVNLSE